MYIDTDVSLGGELQLKSGVTLSSALSTKIGLVNGLIPSEYIAKPTSTTITRTSSGISSVSETINGSTKQTTFVRTNGLVTSIVEVYKGKTKTTTLTRTNGTVTSVSVVET